MDCLYISHTGLTEPLGRSQVLPYLLRLSARGYSITVLSHEPANASAEAMEEARDLVESGRLAWIPTRRSASHSLPTKAFEASRASLLGLATALRHRPRIIHARSYLPAAVADVIASVTPRAKMLFDCRGMLGDEYVDAGHWTTGRLEYRALKRFERRAFSRTDGLVVLTHALADWLQARALVRSSTAIEVIPCCVDADRFCVSPDVRADARRELGIGDHPLLVYSGTLGSWYQAQEMVRFAARLRATVPDLGWLVITPSEPVQLMAAARKAGLEQTIMVRRAHPRDMPRLLSAGDLGISFIRPCFSKMGSSPTKVAEYLAAGMGVIVNTGVGDQDSLAAAHDACVVVDSTREATFERAASWCRAHLQRPLHERMESARSLAREQLDLDCVAVPRYEAIYRKLMSSG